MKPSYGRIRNARYSWHDPEFNLFMNSIMQSLEPIKFEKNTIILNELDEVSEVTFIIGCQYHVGFSLNREMHFRLKMKVAIGAYNLTFNKRSQYIFKT
jgi:hypothetical protein